MIEFICGLLIGSFIAVVSISVLNVTKDKDEKPTETNKISIPCDTCLFTERCKEKGLFECRGYKRRGQLK